MAVGVNTLLSVFAVRSYICSCGLILGGAWEQVVLPGHLLHCLFTRSLTQCQPDVLCVVYGNTHEKERKNERRIESYLQSTVMKASIGASCAACFCLSNEAFVRNIVVSIIASSLFWKCK